MGEENPSSGRRKEFLAPALKFNRLKAFFFFFFEATKYLYKFSLLKLSSRLIYVYLVIFGYVYIELGVRRVKP